MDSKLIKDTLKDAGLHLRDAGKRWPQYPLETVRHIEVALEMIKSVAPEIREVAEKKGG